MKQALLIPALWVALLLGFAEGQSSTDVTVETAAKFAAACADNSVGTIIVRRFALVLNDTDFQGLDVPIKLSRNLTIRGDVAALGYWPFLYLGGLNRMTLGEGVTMRFQDIVVDTPQADGALRAPNFQVLTLSRPGANAQVLLGPGAALMISGCFGPTLQLQNVQALPRAEGYPGPQIVEAGLPQPGCVNDTYAPYMKRCWPQVSNFIDVTMVGRRPDAASNPQPTNYVWILHNATAVCRALVPPECIAKLGPAACMLMTVRNSSVLATVLEPPANVTDGTIIRMASEGGTGDGGSNHTLAIVLGCVLGAVGPLVIVAVMVAVVSWRRRTAAGQPMVSKRADDDGSADGNPSSRRGAANACGNDKADGQQLPQPQPSNGADAITDDSNAGTHADPAQLSPTASAAYPALDLITRHTPRQPGIELDVRVAGPAAADALLLAQHQSRNSCGSPPATGTPLAGAHATPGDGSGWLQKQPPGSHTAAIGAAGSGAGPHGATGSGRALSATAEATTALLTSQGSLQQPTDDSVRSTLSSYLPASGAMGMGTSATHEAPAPVTAASADEPPVLTLLPVVRGVGACGRVVEGIYMGQRVAVKLLDRGLLYNYPSSCDAPSTAALLSTGPQPVSGTHAAADACGADAAAGDAALACEAGIVAAAGVAASAPLADGASVVGPAAARSAKASTDGHGVDAADVSLRLGASLDAEECSGTAATAAPPADSVSLQLPQPPHSVAARAGEAPAGAAVSPAELMLGTQQSLAMQQSSTAKPISRKDHISQATSAFQGLTIRHVSTADMPAGAPAAVVALADEASLPSADGTGSSAALARPVALAALAKQQQRHDGDSTTQHAMKRGGITFLGAQHGDSLWGCSTPDGNSSTPAGFGTHAVYRNHLASPGMDGSSLGLSELLGGAAVGGGHTPMDGAGNGAAAPARASDVLQAMAQELEVLAKLAHPNIVKLLAANLSPPTPCLVLELMDTSLDKLLYGGVPGADPGGGLMPLGKVLHVALQIAHAFSYMHPTILHRDLKPANVLVSQPFSATPVVKLADFGLARLQETVLVTARVGVGTAAYMAPECLNALNCVVTHHTDMFSFGVLLYEMLAGERPWEGCSMVQVAYRVTDGQRPPLEELSLERCPRALRSLITACWDPVPERRPAACEVAKELVLIKRKVAEGGGAVNEHQGRQLDVHVFGGRGQHTWEPRPSA